MHRTLLFHMSISFVVLAAVALVPDLAFAQEDGFVALQPEGGVITGNETDFSGVLGQFFRIAISAAAILTVLMIAIGGFKYMGSDAYAQKEDAKDQLTKAILGLLIILGSVLILNTINPNILNFNFFRSADETPAETQRNGSGSQNSQTTQQWCYDTGNGQLRCASSKEQCEQLTRRGSCTLRTETPQGTL